MRNKMSRDGIYMQFCILSCHVYVSYCKPLPPHLNTLLLQLLKEGRVLYLLLRLSSHVVDVSLAIRKRKKTKERIVRKRVINK